ncbi:MAG TPA: hypothetical protein VFH54_18550 [Mycobacteriales bacterium]|nr:hypothetical protein [Mycobacteriales bacterium]
MAESDDRVELTDLDVITRYSLAVRAASADRAELIATLRADLAWLEGGRRSTPAEPPARPARQAPARPAPARAAQTPKAPAKRAAAKATPLRKAPARKVAAKKAAKKAVKKSGSGRRR